MVAIGCTCCQKVVGIHDSVVSVDVVRAKTTDVDSLLYSTRVPVRVSVNKLYVVPKRYNLQSYWCVQKR